MIWQYGATVPKTQKFLDLNGALDDGIDYRGRNWSACHKDKVGIPYVSRQPI